MVQARRSGPIPVTDVRRVAAIARRTERERVTRRLTAGCCTGCGRRAYRVGPFLICRSLTCSSLVVG